MADEKHGERSGLMISSLVIIAGVSLGAALIYARAVLIPFVLALFISVLVGPLLDFLVVRLKIPRIISAFASLLVGVIILLALFLFVQSAVEAVITAIGRSGQGEVSSASEPQADIIEEPNSISGESVAGQYSRSLRQFLEKGVERVEKWGFNVDLSAVSSDLQKNIPGLIKSTFGRVFNFVTSAFLVVIFVIFLVIGRDPRSKLPAVYNTIEAEVRRYLAIKSVVSIVTGLAVWIILRLLGLQLAGVFGMLAFVLNFIPSLGSIIATLLPLPVAAAQYENPWMITLVILLPGAIQISVGNIIEPRLMGSRMKLHPVTVLLALSFWGLLWGGVGMILAVPITAVLRIIFSQFETLEPIALLLSGKLPEMGREQPG